MRLDEATRHDLHVGLEAVLGPERAAALMSALPSDELATKADLAALELRLMTNVERTLREAILTQTKWLVGAVITLLLGMIASTAVLVQTILSRVPLPN